MKRPPGIWFLLSAGVLWISLQDAHGIRATSLIFAKTTTTTTSTEATSSSSGEAIIESSTEPTGNSTKPTLTGIPQIDYIWDPNLPKELNGYNLSSYPFYERVPDEDIEFKCDGLHDGFYASVPHKCQVYHHCLFGTRYDFLCANYTAFDQKTFICHFVSEVDCVNSKKYWHRNDALYQAATTTTIKPQIIYTPPPQPNPVLTASADAPLPKRPLRRPNRKRPQYEYYDDYEDYEYEERPRSRRKRPRPRPRPIYDDEYEEYEDERYERRPVRRRLSGRRRNKDRPKYQDEDEEYRPDESDRRPMKRPAEERRRYKPKRPLEDYYEEEEELPPVEPSTEKQVAVKTVGGSIYDRPRAPPRIKPPVPKTEADKYAYKPVQTVKEPEPAADDYYEDYEEVPKRKQESSESRRYSKPPPRREESRKPQRSRPVKEEPLEEEEERIPVSRNSGRPKFGPKPDEGTPFASRSRDEERNLNRPRKEQVEDEVRTRPKPVKEEPVEELEVRTPSRPPKEEYVEERSTVRPKFVPKVPRPKKPTPPPVEDYYEDYEEQPEETNIQKNSQEIPSTRSTTTTTTTPKPIITTTTMKESQREVVRIVKRPFLPSRGGNPYSSRGLQPVGSKALDMRQPEPIPIEEPFKPSPAILKIPIRAKVTPNSEPEPPTPPATEVIETEEPKANRPRPLIVPKIKPEDYTSLPRTTQKSKVTNNNNRNPVDLDEYDVTLNDALNPTLPNLPVRAFPTGFSAANDYTFSSYQRPRIIVDSGLVPASSDFVYQLAKPAGSNNNQNYKGQFTITRPRLSQVQLQNYYSNF